MGINTHEKFNLMLTLIVGICEYAPPPPPPPLELGEQPNRLDQIGIMVTEVDSGSHSMIFTLSVGIFYTLRAAQ